MKTRRNALQSKLRKGSKVQWNYGAGTATGTIERMSTGRTEITSNGATITRNGTPENPAVVISQDGQRNRILKLLSELRGIG